MMKGFGNYFLLAMLFGVWPIAIATAGSSTNEAPSSPLKIFILVGQSNMNGHGHLDTVDDDTGNFRNGTLEWMVEQDPDTYGKLKTYDENGNASWKERPDIWIAYNRQSIYDVSPKWNQRGPLVAGFGGDGGDLHSKDPSHEMGPELSFGWTVGDALREDDDTKKSSNEASPNILLIKVAWGGRSLAVEYRPPSSAKDDDHKGRPVSTTGLYYEAMIANVYRTLSSLTQLVPGYTQERGYELMGFAWHQGWNDGCDEAMTEEYEKNLANLIRDVRVDLGVPDLPFSIGVSGMNGWTKDDRDNRRTRIINAQLAVANSTKYPEFEGTVASVETRDFFREAKPVSPGDQIYHWNNNCESYWLIGQAMGKAMVDLVRNKKQSKVAARADNETKTSRKNTLDENQRHHDQSMLRGIHGDSSSTM